MIKITVLVFDKKRIDGWKYYGLVAYNEMHITEIPGFEKIEWIDTFWGDD